MEVPETPPAPIMPSEPEPSEPDKKKHICPHCKQEYTPKRGIENWKNLFRKPTLSEWIILFMMIGILVIAYAYQTETSSCRDFMKDIKLNCIKIVDAINKESSDSYFLGGEINQSHVTNQS